MASLLNLELITPDGILLEEPVSQVVAVTEIGEVGILPNHADLKSKLKSAPLRYKNQAGKEDYVAVLGGILEVTKNKVTVITDFAEKSSNINETEAHKAAERAKAEIQTQSTKANRNDRDLLIAETMLQKELLKLQTAQLAKS